MQAVVTKRVAAAVTGPTQKRQFISVAHKYKEAYERYGFWNCLWKLYNPGDIKFGKEVGEDRFGNKYYEDVTEVAGQQRWTEFKVQTHQEFGGDQIPPEWHLWLHQVTDAKPTDPGQKPENWTKVSLVSGSNAPYKTHLGPVGEFAENQTTYRQRAYGEDNHQWLKNGEPDRYYLQPRHPLRLRNRGNNDFDHIDYNNPDAPPKNSSALLRGLDKN
ncbi:hypothetical protein DYB37_005159 [Aphanomyces astaci]|uniref:NADH dehydrogenase [ubiquinone] 1 alpha subcomplex subunit 12 n=1 Tax=Aphanomyces astaci TaxID=112090 RepID=A0A397DSH5_APHAT|nr:hypothetical protein DYB34_002124 [Aphanomyces astaci]RHY67557.1 hypothetical protein DYB30_006578 [Aphanomyces astaci]RHY87794.1 hypothetical protein DYB35_004161 [Aphanomyces astaci]RHZ08783.1 hypothetical protein DYB31_011861 [Aphanomyces astaci]RHZ14242.1 hypothetical protein DYB37_005159 [Aphanomyces astaci]